MRIKEIIFNIKVIVLLVELKIINQNHYKYSEIRNTVIKYTKLDIFKKYSIIFYPFYDLFTKSPSICIDVFQNIKISHSFLNLLLSDETKYNMFFKLSVGHEISHLNINFKCETENKKEQKFLYWIEEVYCDFNATSIVGVKDKQILTEFIETKLKLKPHNKETKTHLSWKQRLTYAQTGKFDEHLIRQIYKDSGCKNNILLSEVIDFYKDKYIVLK